MLMYLSLSVSSWIAGRRDRASASAIACALILWMLLRTGLAWRLATDIPNDRSLHTRPTPRVGGWGIVPVAVVAILLAGAAAVARRAAGTPCWPRSRRSTTGAACPRACVSPRTWRRWRSSSADPAPVPGGCWRRWRFYALAGQSLQFHGRLGRPGGRHGVVRLRWLRGRRALSAHHAPELGAGCGRRGGRGAGFPVFNFHPARIFLGDAGSIPLGFLAGALGYWGWRDGVWPLWFPGAGVRAFYRRRFGDACCARLLRGEKFWQAHREHYYQRMVRSGMGHASTALVWYL